MKKAKKEYKRVETTSRQISLNQSAHIAAEHLKQDLDVIADITAKRGSIYGPFLHNAIVAQALKEAMRRIPDPDNEGHRWENLPFDVREGLDLIALKISRIICGNHEYLDNWDDIGGYAKIVSDRIRRSHT